LTLTSTPPRKKACISASDKPGCSTAAKCPPFAISVQCATAYVFSTSSRGGGGNTGSGNAATPVGTVIRVPAGNCPDPSSIRPLYIQVDVTNDRSTRYSMMLVSSHV
jgi:hypothetical protein